MSTTPTIFVSVAAYQDPYLWWTIQSAWDNASKPSRVVFGVVDQSVESQREQTKIMPWSNAVRYVHLHPRYARGPCFARAMAYSLWNYETYLLQIDSHMWFEKGWDETLCQEMLAVQIESGHPRHIITTYPRAFEFRDGQPADAGSPKGVLVLRPKPDEHLKPDDPVIGFQAMPVEAKTRVPGYHIGAGAMFSAGTLLLDVPYDPFLYFHGEEQNLAARAWTHGWDIWHPFNMPILHLYKQGQGKEIVHWSPSEDEMREFRWHELQRRALQQNVMVLYHQSIKGAYGLGTQRTLQQFAQESGIDYINKTVDKDYVIKIPIPPPPKPIGFATMPTPYTVSLKN